LPFRFECRDREYLLSNMVGDFVVLIGALERPLASAARRRTCSSSSEEPAQLLVVHDDAFAPEQNMQAVGIRCAGNLAISY
jgi:hypothetical protein